jgi:hypothetical protein
VRPFVAGLRVGARAYWRAAGMVVVVLLVGVLMGWSGSPWLVLACGVVGYVVGYLDGLAEARQDRRRERVEPGLGPPPSTWAVSQAAHPGESVRETVERYRAEARAARAGLESEVHRAQDD